MVLENIAMLFPGQGAQKVGMGFNLYQKYPECKSVFDSASEILNKDMYKIVFDGDETTLRDTVNTQLSVFIVSMMYFEFWKNNYGVEGIKYFAGHSLGEFTALCASGTIDFEQCLQLVNKRASLMKEYCSPEYGMLAVIGFDKDFIEGLVLQLKIDYDIANINTKKQIVISGKLNELEKIKDAVSDKNGESRLLNVAGAFHSKYMIEANNEFINEIDKFTFNQPKTFFVPNYTAELTMDVDEIKNALKKQMMNSVNWYDTIINIKNEGADAFYDIGPGHVLKKLCAGITFKPKCYSVEDMHSLC